MATILPPGVTQFIDANGNPLAGGSVTFYVPNTTVPKDTWQDSGQTILNTNPVILDSAGEALIYGSGVYRQIVKDANGNLIWDQLTADTAVGGLLFGGTSTGTANAQFIVVSGFTGQDGQQVSFIAGITNTSAMTISLSGGPPISVLKDTDAGPVPLTGGEIVLGNAYTMLYDATRGAFHLVSIPQDDTRYVPVSSVLDFAGTIAPAGFFLCYGQAVSRSTYTTLFNAVGTTYGVGDGTTTFNIPDARGRVSAGKDDMGGTPAGRLNVTLTGNRSSTANGVITGISSTSPLTVGMKAVGTGIGVNAVIVSIDSGTQVTLSVNNSATGSGTSIRFGTVDGATLGDAGGSQTHTLTIPQMPAHTHPYNDMARNAVSGTLNGAGPFADLQDNARTTSSTGGGGAHNNVQPTIILNKIIRF